MKKIFTLALALIGLAGVVNAQVDKLAPLKHNYVLVIDDYSNNGTQTVKAGMIGDDHFYLAKDMPAAANKGKADLSVEGDWVDAETVKKYGAYGEHLNSARLKNADITMAMYLYADTKVIVYHEGNGKAGKEARYPKIAKDAKLENALNAGPTESTPAVVQGQRWEYTVEDEGVYYLGSYNGDMFVSYVIIEPVEAPGTPSVKVGPQGYENGLYYRDVTCTPMDYADGIPTIVYYTTDGSEPTLENGKIYEENKPIRCYDNMTVKFQAYMDIMGDPNLLTEDMKALNADNEAVVTFQFDAPTITADGAKVTIASPYDGATNYYTLDKDTIPVQSSEFTLAKSATVTAYSEIVNGDYATFKTNSVSKDVYVLTPIKTKKTIQVTAGDVEVDEEATATSTTGTIYKVVNGAISADEDYFFVKNLEFAVVKDELYQINGEERYIKMNNTNITFEVAEGDSVDVKVTTSLNSCKTLNADDDPSVTTDRKNYVNVSGTTYGNDDVTAENGNIIEFGLIGGKTYTFQKYSGTGNIMIYSIEITPATDDPSGITNVNAVEKTGAIYNLAGQKVDAQYKGVVIQNGKKVVIK